MAARIRRSSTSSSRTQQRDSTRFSNPDVFSDEYALESLQVSDGFRPQVLLNGAHHTTSSGDSRPAPDPADASSQVHYEHGAGPTRRSPSSRKSGYDQRRTSFLARSDGSRQISPHNVRASVHSNETSISALSPSVSRASTFTMPRTQSPYQGATGPSHPYGMYAQDIGVFRTSSTTTTSTVRPQERSYTGPTGPTQPYGMYPQNTVPEEEITPVQTLHPPISVGFPDRSQNYRRRLGPDAEDADDLIGPDGYTEQLPPYTRYPDGVPPKRDGPGPASILSAERDQDGTSEATLANPFQSRESLPAHLEINQSSTELTAVAGSDSPEQDVGGNFKERVKEKSRKRICFGALPLWAIAILVVLMVAVLAGVVGAVVGRARGEEQAASTTPPPLVDSPPVPAVPATVIITTTSLVDATPLPSIPADLPALPTGTFYVPLRNPTILNDSCLTSQVNAWDCSITTDLKLDLSIPQMVSISPRFSSAPNQVRFGPQPPHVDEPVSLQLMGDKDGMERGPAWFFQQPYTKLVILPGKTWEAGSQFNRRWFDVWGGRRTSLQPEARGYGSAGIAPPAAKPWFCYWNNTILEGFIYVTQNSSDRAPAGSSNSPSPASPTGYFTPATGASNDEDQPVASFQQPNAAMPTDVMQRRYDSDPSQLTAYPKIVKMVERRDASLHSQPYCMHMQIMNDGTAQPLPEPSVTLTEIPPDYDQDNHQALRERARGWNIWERGDSDSSTSACECEWVSG
ncbi:MAG: hypothetical protein LQ346_004309 [Caloplaca aetnensis]|nr:MAG: hypothetical protein LQ346_004309 [Caloplaca aetnensis]